MYLLNKTMNGIRLYYLILLGILYLSFYQSSIYFLFFTNTILAYIPIELTFLAIYCKKKYIIVVVVCLWLVFLPNNFYLMTDLFHLSLLTPYDEVTLLISKDLMNWIKLFLILLAVMPSTILGCWSIDKIARILVEKLTIGVYPALLIACLLFMDSIGIYIGRFTRLNSTDIFVRHNQALQKIFADFEDIDNRSIVLLLLLYLFLCGIMIGYQLIKQLLYKNWEESVKSNGCTHNRRQSSHK